MPSVREIELADILGGLPDIFPFDIDAFAMRENDDLFLCALGFEQRSLSLPERIMGIESYRVAHAICFEYDTNIDDNELNKPRLTTALKSFSGSVRSMRCDDIEFAQELRDTLREVCQHKEFPKIVFDISTCSSKLLLLTIKVLFEFDVDLLLLYSEAAIYHPTHEEYEDDPLTWCDEEGFGLARGVGRIIPSSEHPGDRRDNLPEAIVAFPTFKPERTKAVITDIDESLLLSPRDRVMWIVGVPHIDDDYWRTRIMKEINKITELTQACEISTFTYKDTMRELERIYKKWYCRYHITIAPFGSKLQSFAISLFWIMRQDVSLVFASPESYNARQYSEGCKDFWSINFGDLRRHRDSLSRVGQLEIIG